MIVSLRFLRLLPLRSALGAGTRFSTASNSRNATVTSRVIGVRVRREPEYGQRACFSSSPATTMYPSITPYDTGKLKVSDLHTL